MASRSDLHDAARTYATSGWAVFPLKPRDKRPATPNGFKDASLDLRVVDLWWDSNPNFNIGLPTGIAFDVLDLDGPEAIAALHSFPGFPEGYRHPGPTSATGKGWHLLFQPTGRGNGAALLGPDSKIDFRGAGGYIVAPPSIHPKGHRYSWVRSPQLLLPEPPGWLIGVLEHRGIHEPQEPLPARKFIWPAGVAAVAKDQLNPVSALRASRPDILEVAAELGLPIYPRNGYVETTCIYHADHSPSLALWPDNRFNCWSCGAKGDSLDLQRRTAMNL